MAKQARAVKDEWIWLQSMNDKERWSLTFIPPGEDRAPFIKRMSKNSDGSYTFYVYRNGKCLGATKTLEKAQALGKSGKVDTTAIEDNKAMLKYVDTGDRSAALFAKLSKVSQLTIANVYPWAMPRRLDMEAKGVKHVPTARTDLLSNREKAATRSNKWNMEQKIKRKDKTPNPKKQGSIQWQRWEIVHACDGKTVAEFFSKGGDKYGLEGALDHGWIELVS
jgi:hypothetical protein